MANNQPVKIKTALAEEDLLFHTMEGSEELGRPFLYNIELLSPKEDLALDDVLGQPACVELALVNGEARYFHGMVTHFSQGGRHGDYAQYRMQLRPWLWLLTRVSDCRIFQGKTAPEIIKEVFRDRGFSDFKDALSGTYRTWEYCVQYRETDFNFVSRLMEQEGIYYYFTHEDGKHTLVLADSYGAHGALAGYDTISYFPPTESARDEHIFDWYLDKSVQPGKYTLRAYDFRKPKANLDVNSTTANPHGHAEFELYDYPGEYFERAEGDIYARTRLEDLQTQYERVHGAANVRGICTGGLFTLADYPRKDQNREYLVLSSQQSIALGEYESGESEGLKFRCTFEAMPSQTPFRLAAITPKPIVQGPQTAIVVGKAGEEIWTDEYGRIKVQFHWDRHGKADENSSCWMRVAQVWAGAQWGALWTPRIGHEVMVDFIEGDPDRPIVTGRVYNADNMPPYKQPDHKTKSGIKSRSSKGGGGFNELRFEDLKGEEQVFLHAEKNLDIRVKHDRFETVLNNRHLVVEVDKLEHVKNDRHEKVDHHHSEEIAGDRHLKISGKEAKAVKSSLSLTVDGDVAESFKADHSEQTSGDYYLKAANIVIEATSNVTIKVGSSFIAIEAGGIKIGTSGQIVLDAKATLKATGTGGVQIESPAQTQIQGTQTSVKGSAMVEVQGGIVKIN